MKKIEAIVRQNKLEDVKEALLRCGVDGMTVSEVFGRGDQKAPLVTYRGVTGSTSFVPRVKLETVVADDQAERVLDAIFQAAHTGQVGDGHILVSALESVTRIRTGEVDETDAAFVHHRAVAPAMPMAAVSASFEVYDERFK
jgi:nitrogen regulatory protein P-II 1